MLAADLGLDGPDILLDSGVAKQTAKRSCSAGWGCRAAVLVNVAKREKKKSYGIVSTANQLASQYAATVL